MYVEAVTRHLAELKSDRRRKHPILSRALPGQAAVSRRRLGTYHQWHAGPHLSFDGDEHDQESDVDAHRRTRRMR